MRDKKIIKEVLDVSLPVVLELTVYNFLYILDMMLVGKYGGGSEVSEFGICNNIYNTFLNIFIFTGICIGITTLASQSYGARKYIKAKEYAEMGFLLGIIISTITVAIIFFNVQKMLVISGVKRANLKETCEVLKMFSISLFFCMNINVINSILRSYGNSMEPFRISLYVGFFKVIFDLTFIFTNIFRTSSVLSVSIASVLAQFLGFIIDYYYVTRVPKAININVIFKIKVRKIIELLKLSIPSSCEEAAYSLTRLACTFIIMRAGTVAFASNEIANSIEAVSLMPGTGFGAAVTTLVGINYGRRNFKALKKCSYECFYYSFFMMSFFAVIFLFFSHFLVGFFISEEKIIYYASICLAIGAFEQPAIALSMNFSGALKGMGDTKTPFIVTFISSCVIRLPLTFIFIYILKRPIYYVWWITLIEWVFDGMALFICFTIKIKRMRI
ncbi:MATE family efflux transporter [Clostridium guangxiense]|uniref:MATE family efflux transporter n=1 Tax=Clostridium guangxiense TaxID=1662055 RepID=UPI001E50E675|nr:MATE family efflux transporter [Clostridium guangxiense]